MRRLLPALLVAVVLEGCGEDPDSPLDSVLGLFGDKAPFVAVVDTDLRERSAERGAGDRQALSLRSAAARPAAGPRAAAPAARLVRQIAPGGGLGGLFGPRLFLGPLGPFEASVRAEPEVLSGGFVQRFD